MRYFVAEGWRAFSRNGLMSLAAVVITMVTLLALGATLVVAGTVDQLVRQIEQQLQVVVYLRDGLSADRLAAVRDHLAALPGVTGVDYVSKEQALARLQRAVGRRAEFRDLLPRNPLPASFVISVDRAARLREVAARAATSRRRAARSTEITNDAGRGLRGSRSRNSARRPTARCRRASACSFET